MTETPSPVTTQKKGGLLDAIEWLGNKLPDPAFLFLIGAGIVMVASHLAAPAVNDAGEIVREGWVVQPMQPGEQVDPDTGRKLLEASGEPERAKSLLTSEGLYWCLKHMVENFMNFPPLGVVLVGILGIGVAERTGLIASLLKTFMAVVPRNLLTPTMVFLGIMSSVGSDAGYIVLPPLAAAIYLAAGRSPLAGIAAVFAGVSAGFNANLLITTLEPIMAEFSTQGAQIIDPTREVVATSTWYFMAASTFLVTGIGWMTSALFVEKRLERKSADDGGPDPAMEEPPGPSAWSLPVVGALLATVIGSGLGIALLVSGLGGETPALGLARTGMAITLLAGVGGSSAFVGMLARKVLEATEARATLISTALITAIPGLTALLVLLPDLFPSIETTLLYGTDGRAQRWVVVVVPIMFLTFVIPGLAHGIVMKTIKTSKDASKLMIDSIAAMAPIIVLAFFAAQFIEYFTYSNLGRMLAYTGGQWLYEQNMHPALLIAAFIGVTMVFNLFVGSMSAKYALFAPIFIPMFMFAGIRPETTMVAYRIGDSVTNIITPLNAYLIIILVYIQKYAPRAGMGTLIAMMLPYTVVFAVFWTIFLLVWDAMGWPLGVGDPVSVSVPVE